MARPPRRSGSDSAGPPPATEAAAAQNAAARRPLEAAVVSRPEMATNPAPTSSSYAAPPQGPGAPQQLRHDGSPYSEERLNTAMKILLDPAARALPSKVYSGQARNWTR